MKKVVWLLAFALCTPLWADTLTLKPGHPQTYVVKKGDTLWDISALFLDDPWRWPTLWGANPQIANPHLIYPGDRLTLVFLDGQPRLVRKPMKRLSPQMEVSAKGGAVPAVPLSVIEPYLSFHQVLGPDELDEAPTVLGGERQAVRYADDDTLFIDQRLPIGARYGVYQPGRKLYDPDGKRFLGQEAELAATGQVVESGAISRLLVRSVRQEIRPGQRLKPIVDATMLPAYFMPHPAPEDLTGRVIGSDGKLTEIGPLQVAIINRGSEDGAQPGQVFAIHQPGQEVVESGKGDTLTYRDELDRRVYDDVMALLSDGRVIVLPEVYRGEMILFKTYDQVSYGLIINGRRPVRIEDRVLRPDPMVFGSDSSQ
ncbi:LysM peptidoglycan-binding domain-containing protein [Ferrimonas marina]|uniref:LysM domain-containing protein n=1 Tax=Ferrimonas marina TaxID=299255 RepID=A0A1M5ZI48_9GAMM|nr:LysM domain-containing protein [Ferrimonas marina]SHI23603.1 LysM domain-containing protein [Ferrimonas marina]